VLRAQGLSYREICNATGFTYTKVNRCLTEGRQALSGRLAGIEVVEAGRNGTKGMCCGAGGARMWMEEHTGKQVNVERSQELIATGPPGSPPRARSATS